MHSTAAFSPSPKGGRFTLVSSWNGEGLSPAPPSQAPLGGHRHDPSSFQSPTSGGGFSCTESPTAGLAASDQGFSAASFAVGSPGFPGRSSYRSSPAASLAPGALGSPAPGSPVGAPGHQGWPSSPRPAMAHVAVIVRSPGPARGHQSPLPGYPGVGVARIRSPSFASPAGQPPRARSSVVARGLPFVSPAREAPPCPPSRVEPPPPPPPPRRVELPPRQVAPIAIKNSSAVAPAWDGAFTEGADGTTPWSRSCLEIGGEGIRYVDSLKKDDKTVVYPTVQAAQTQKAVGQLVAMLDERSVARAMGITVTSLRGFPLEVAARMLIDVDRGHSISRRVTSPSSPIAARSFLIALFKEAEKMFPGNKALQLEAVYEGDHALVIRTLDSREASSRERLASKDSEYDGATAPGQLVKGGRFAHKHLNIPFDLGGKDAPPNAAMLGYPADNSAFRRRASVPVSINLIWLIERAALNSNTPFILRGQCFSLCLMLRILSRSTQSANAHIIGAIQRGAFAGEIGRDKSGLRQGFVLVGNGVYRGGSHDFVEAYFGFRAELGEGYPYCLLLETDNGWNPDGATCFLKKPLDREFVTPLLRKIASKLSGVPISQLGQITAGGIRKAAAATAGALSLRRDVIKWLCRHAGCALRIESVSITLAEEWAREDRDNLIAGRYDAAGEVDRVIEILELTFDAMAEVVRLVGIDNLPLVPEDGKFFGDVAHLQLDGWHWQRLLPFQ